jgi:hypothetical protein
MPHRRAYTLFQASKPRPARRRKPATGKPVVTRAEVARLERMLADAEEDRRRAASGE